MGLDVYLYRYDDKADHDRRAAELEARKDKLQAEMIGEGDNAWSTATEEAKKAYFAKAKDLDIESGLGYFDPTTCKYEGRIGFECLDKQNSALHPEHMFKVGYFRSSYNEGGINRILRDRIGVDLGDIFVDGDEYEFQPDWTASLARAKEARDAFAKHLEEFGSFQVATIEHNPFTALSDFEATSGKRALEIFHKQAKGRDSHWFSCRDGHFMPQGIKVHAVITGTDKSFAGVNPCVYVVYEDSEDSGLAWYLQALDVVVETCEFVLASKDPSQFWLHWSG